MKFIDFWFFDSLCRYLKLPQHLPIGNYSRIKTDQICVLTISDPHFSPFSDISLKHRMFFMVGFQILSGYGGTVNISRFEKRIILI